MTGVPHHDSGGRAARWGRDGTTGGGCGVGGQHGGPGTPPAYFLVFVNLLYTGSILRNAKTCVRSSGINDLVCSHSPRDQLSAAIRSLVAALLPRQSLDRHVRPACAPGPRRTLGRAANWRQGNAKSQQAV